MAPIRLAKFYAKFRLSHLLTCDSRTSATSELCRDHRDEVNDTKKSVIRCHSHSAILANAAIILTPLWREISTLNENNHDVAQLPMVENRMAQ